MVDGKINEVDLTVSAPARVKTVSEGLDEFGA